MRTVLKMARVCPELTFPLYLALITPQELEWRGVSYMTEMLLQGRKVKSGWKSNARQSWEQVSVNSLFPVQLSLLSAFR